MPRTVQGVVRVPCHGRTGRTRPWAPPLTGQGTQSRADGAHPRVRSLSRGIFYSFSSSGSVPQVSAGVCLDESAFGSSFWGLAVVGGVWPSTPPKVSRLIEVSPYLFMVLSAVVGGVWPSTPPKVSRLGGNLSCRSDKVCSIFSWPSTPPKVSRLGGRGVPPLLYV